jgi:ABC-type amino acid transport substrate-binding protein
MGKASLTGPIEVARFWKNRRGEAIVVRLSTYEGHTLIDQRTWFTATDGALKPGKGLACAVRHLPELAAAVNKALTKARELGLVDTDGTDDEGDG